MLFRFVIIHFWSQHRLFLEVTVNTVVMTITFVVSQDRHPDTFDDPRVSRPLGVTFVVSRDPVPHTALDTPAIVRAYRYCTVLGSSHLRLLVVQVLCVFGDVLPFAFGLLACLYYELCFVHVQVKCM